ncbi:hypothetical protein BPAE_0187g00050 [Botrytis paeoniae]|uniref:Uncharacterized protein n=1 Tax=Botrytis paeoniae TaxID=278948 RepID=A0A4Z1FC47_9HELO|nr:hypothetical protein BPAE_0187g00050 [Botrytis paeoniae]
MASESSATGAGVEPQEYPHDFDAITPQSTAWACQSSRTSRVVETALMNQTLTQTTILKVVRVAIKATVGVKLICWSCSNGPPNNGNPNITFDGPINGKLTIDTKRLGGYRVEIR